VSDSGGETAGWVKRLENILKKVGIECVFSPYLSRKSIDAQVEQGAKLYRESGADVIVAIGVESSLEIAKSIAIMVSNGGKVSDYEGDNSFRYPLPQMMFITTATGSGADFSNSCIITGWLRLQYIPIIRPSRAWTAMDGRR
jgi:alcohol dehydrogenase